MAAPQRILSLPCLGDGISNALTRLPLTFLKDTVYCLIMGVCVSKNGYIYMCACGHEVRRGHRSRRGRVTGGWELFDFDSGNWIRTLEKQQALIEPHWSYFLFLIMENLFQKLPTCGNLLSWFWPDLYQWFKEKGRILQGNRCSKRGLYTNSPAHSSQFKILFVLMLAKDGMFLNYYSIYLCLCAHTCVPRPRHLVGVFYLVPCSLLLPCSFWALSSGHQMWWKAS